MIHIVSWFWGNKYKPYFLMKLRKALVRNIKQPFIFHVVTDAQNNNILLPGCYRWNIADPQLLQEPGCIVRMRLFDWKWLEAHSIKKGEKVVNLDIDSIVTGQLDPLFDMYEEFAILQGINSTNPNPYNGSFWMFKAGDYQDVWDEFSLEALHKVPKHSIFDDQAWLHHMLPNACEWGPEQGVYGFKKKHWPSGDDLPENARLVVFPGRRDPRKLGHLDWVDTHWGAVHKMSKQELAGLC